MYWWLFADLLISSFYSDNFTREELILYILLKRILSILYLVEYFLEVFSFGLKGFFSIKLNKIQTILITGIIIGNLDFLLNKVHPFFNRICRNLQLLFLIQLILKTDRICSIMRIIIFSISLTFHFLILFCSFIFIYSIIGCYLFYKVKTGVYVSDYVNYHNFIFGMGTLFKVVSSDDWQYLMFDFSKINEGSSYL